MTVITNQTLERFGSAKEFDLSEVRMYFSDVDSGDGRVPRQWRGGRLRQQRQSEVGAVAVCEAGRRQDELGRQEEARGFKVSQLLE